MGVLLAHHPLPPHRRPRPCRQRRVPDQRAAAAQQVDHCQDRDAARPRLCVSQRCGQVHREAPGPQVRQEGVRLGVGPVAQRRQPNIRKLVMTPRDKLQEVSIFSKRGEWTLKKGVRAGKVDLPTDFSVSFGLTPTKKINGWANILHVTATGGNCCRYGDRVPAIWFYSRTTRFHMIDGHQRVGNDECPITQQLPLNKRTNVKIDMRPTQCNVYFNNKKMCTEKRADRKKFKKATVWAADPWHNVAAAKMYNLRFSSARVEGSTGGKSCKGDIDGNNKVNIEDLLALLGNYGKTGTNKADGNGDKKVDIEDLLIVLGAYGKSC